MKELKTLTRENFEYKLYEVNGYEVEVRFYKGELEHVYVSVEERDSYLPNIYFEDGRFGSDEKSFTIQTTSYGALKPEDIQKVIKGYEQAMDVVAILTKKFLEK